MLKGYRSLPGIFLFFASLLILFSTVARAQNSVDQEPDLQQFQQHFKKDYFSVGALLQTIGDFQPERTLGENGFSVGNARLKVFGEFDQGFGYQLQTNFTRTTPLLDANIYYQFSEGFQIKTGLFKSPFSYEFLTGAAAIDFVNRSSVVNQLVPNRQIGAQISGKTTDGILQYSLGAFNGNGFGINRNNDDQLLYVGRLEAQFDTGQQQRNSGNQIIFGVNASREIKDQPSFIGNIQGEQTLLGSDVRITQGDLMLSGEFIYSWLESSDNGIHYNPFGYHATAGYYITPKTQLLARWDYFKGDNLGGNTENILAGINIFPTSVSEIQLNYIIPTERSIEFSQILLNFQLSI